MKISIPWVLERKVNHQPEEIEGVIECDYEHCSGVYDGKVSNIIFRAKASGEALRLTEHEKSEAHSDLINEGFHQYSCSEDMVWDLPDHDYDDFGEYMPCDDEYLDHLSSHPYYPFEGKE